MSRGAPDFHRITTVRYEVIPPEELARITPVPIGDTVFEGSTDATSDTFTTIASYTVPDGRKFHLAKVLFNCRYDTWYQLLWDGQIRYGPVLVAAKVPWTDWFPLMFLVCEGDGVKKLEVQAKYDYTSGYAYAQIAGELE